MNKKIENKVSNLVQAVPPPLIDESSFGVAFERRLAEIKAVPDEEIVVHNLDATAAVTTILGVLPEIQRLRGELERLPQLDQKLVSGLEDYAQATGEANARYAIALIPKDITALYEAAVKEREMLRTDALALAHRGLIDPERLAGFKGLVGYKNVAFELIEYASLFLDCWPDIEGKTPVTRQEVQDAKRLGVELVKGAGLKEQGPVVAAEAAKTRQQAMTLLVRSYDEVRRGIAFIRWRLGDVNTIAPSLYAGRGGRRRPDEASDELESPPATPVGQLPAPAATPTSNATEGSVLIA